MRVTKRISTASLHEVSLVAAGLSAKVGGRRLVQQAGYPHAATLVVATPFAGTPLTRLWDCTGACWHASQLGLFSLPKQVSNTGRTLYSADTAHLGWWAVAWDFPGLGRAKALLCGHGEWLLDYDMPRHAYTPRCLEMAEGVPVFNRTEGYAKAFRFLLDEAAIIGGGEGWEDTEMFVGQGVKSLGLRHYHFGRDGILGHLSLSEQQELWESFTQPLLV
ncbi:MAG: hypothetical protein WAX89_07770 [Alphaproteobacteria bacterium]